MDTNTVIQCLTLNYDLDLEPTLVKHMYCTSTHHTWHLCRVICESHQGFKRYRADKNTVIQCFTLNYDFDLEPTLVKDTHCTSIHHTWLFENPIRDSKDIERTRKRDGQTDRQTDGRTDGRTDGQTDGRTYWQTDRRMGGRTDGPTDIQTTELKTLCLPILWGET